jgi:restriction endonuclease S subunit
MDEKFFSNFHIKKPVVSFGMSPIKLKEIANIFRGASYRSTDLMEQGNWRFLRPRDVRENEILLGKTYVTKDFINKNQNKILKDGDIILQNIFDFKKISLVTDDDLPAIASNNFYIIRSLKINPRFLYNYLQSTTILKEFQKQLDIIATGATIKRIKINDLKEIFVPIPVSEEQINWFMNIQNYDEKELIEINKQITELKEAYKIFLNSK